MSLEQSGLHRQTDIVPTRKRMGREDMERGEGRVVERTGKIGRGEKGSILRGRFSWRPLGWGALLWDRRVYCKRACLPGLGFCPSFVDPEIPP